MSRAEIKILNGGPTLFIDGKPFFPMLHWAPTPPIEGEWIGDRVVKDFSEAGIHLISLGVDIGDDGEVHPYEGAISEVRDRKRVLGVGSLPNGKNYTDEFS
ncbi:MAG: hypothetical protein DRN61_04350, partial [Thaumarchaeota archaeon]